MQRPWVMVAVSTVMAAMGFGVLFTMAVFLTPLAAEFGWPRADVSLAYALATIGTGLGGVMMGHFADRMPVRRIAITGAVVPAAALALLSSTSSLAELYAYHALMGLFGVGAILAPLNSVAAKWLARNPGLAIGILSAGGAAGQGLVPFFARHLVLVDGWRHAYLVLGLVYLAIMLPLALAIRDAPRPTAAAMAASVVSYARSRIHVLAVLCVAVVFCCVCMATPIMHVVALGSDLGLVFSGAMSSLIACGREYSPPGRTGLSIGVVMFAGWVGMALGAWQGGLFYDLCGDYFVSFSNASFAGVVNLLLLGLLYLYTVKGRIAPRPANLGPAG